MLTEVDKQKHRRAMKLKTMVKPQSYRQEVAVKADEVTEDGGTRTVDSTLSLPPHSGMHVFLLDCGHLEPPKDDGTENRMCTIYAERPTACRNFEMGSAACLSARARFGLDGHEATAQLNRKEPLRFDGWRQLD
jgi:Fe-S-cluster containining protein